ncbi:MAG: DUF3551 domain-containing protein [Bradyrhizobium sp.]|nr:DUF3551 domain-containing protein [Bradyrhizobium sp.]
MQGCRALLPARAAFGLSGNCDFSTYEQCKAAASGMHAHCGVNPYYAHQHHRGHGR